jgi:hypothetical protein
MLLASSRRSTGSVSTLSASTTMTVVGTLMFPTRPLMSSVHAILCASGGRRTSERVIDDLLTKLRRKLPRRQHRERDVDACGALTAVQHGVSLLFRRSHRSRRRARPARAPLDQPAFAHPLCAGSRVVCFGVDRTATRAPMSQIVANSTLLVANLTLRPAPS